MTLANESTISAARLSRSHDPWATRQTDRTRGTVGKRLIRRLHVWRSLLVKRTGQRRAHPASVCLARAPNIGNRRHIASQTRAASPRRIHEAVARLTSLGPRLAPATVAEAVGTIRISSAGRGSRCASGTERAAIVIFRCRHDTGPMTRRRRRARKRQTGVPSSRRLAGSPASIRTALLSKRTRVVTSASYDARTNRTSGGRADSSVSPTTMGRDNSHNNAFQVSIALPMGDLGSRTGCTALCAAGRAAIWRNDSNYNALQVSIALSPGNFGGRTQCTAPCTAPRRSNEVRAHREIGAHLGRCQHEQ
jgi:hypothetical protein